MFELSLSSALQALAGGLLIGLAASLLILLNGRIAGISGIVGGLLNQQTSDLAWRIAFLAGLIIAPLVYGWVHALPAVEIKASTATLLVAGLLVGIGTRYGSGCTSGHGVCGIARLSRRSIVATLVFMASGALTVYVTRHLLG